MASVNVEKLIKKYGDLEVLHSIDLDVEDGQFVVLLGPSGCGKSTLLRTIAGLESSTSGNISIGERNVNGMHPKDRNIAMVFQNYALYAHMKVRDNMAFSMHLNKTPAAQIEERINWAASILNLEPYLDRYPKELSGGQRQRVAMGRAIVRNPDVFLFDEPLSNLDAKLRVQMRTEIKELHQRLKTTTVYVTHDQIEAMTMADVVVIMRDGRIEQMGSPMDIYDNPSNLFVAEFIGSPGMNLLKGRIVEEGGQMVCRVNELDLPMPQHMDVSAGQNVLYGIRPEHLIPSETGVKATISVVEPTGPETHLFCHLSGHDVCAVSRDRKNWQADEVISVDPILEFVHVFDAETNQAIRRKT